MRFTTDATFARLEEAYRAYLAAWGEWMVDHHRGIDASTEAHVAKALVDARTAVATQLNAGEWDGLDADDAAALQTLRACLPDLDSLAEPLDGRIFPDGSAVAPPAGLTEAGELRALRRRTFDAWGAAMAAIIVDDERLDRLTVSGRLARDESEERRRALFLAMEPAWRTLNEDDQATSPYRRLIASSAERWARHGSPIEANAAALGLEPESVEPTLRRALAAFRASAMPSELLEPWNYRHALGGLFRRLDRHVAIADLRLINDAHLRSIGADPETLGIHYDIHPRPGRPIIPTAFTVTRDAATLTADGTWTGATPWVFATYAEGGLGNLEELVHESGHALHYAAIRTRPASFAWPPEQTAFVEAIADVVAWSTHEPAFLREHVGADVSVQESVRARYGGVMMDAAWTLFEIELHRHPDRSPNQTWAEIMERDLGVRGHQEWSWWAGRGQLIDAPGYLANYALGSVMVAAVRARIRALRGDWATGDPGWYAFVSEALLRHGGARSPRDLLTSFLGGPLTSDALLADIETGG